MIIHQISVFIENKPGRLTEIVSSLSEKGIDIRALIAGALGAKLAVGQNQPDPQQAPAAPAEAAPPAAGQAEEPER